MNNPYSENIFENLPSIKTDRLLLRKMVMTDAKDLFKYASRPEVIKYSIGEPHEGVEDSERFIASVLDAYESNIAGLWCITRQDNPEVIGTCGFEMWFHEHYRGEIGYSLSPDHWGRGYMTEAVRGVIKFGFERMGLNRIEAVCHIENDASLRVLEKVGMGYEGKLRQHTFSRGIFYDVEMWAIVRSDYEENRVAYKARILSPIN